MRRTRKEIRDMTATAPTTAEYIPSRRSLELCPRSYDVVERAELDTLCVQWNMLWR